MSSFFSQLATMLLLVAGAVATEKVLGFHAVKVGASGKVTKDSLDSKLHVQSTYQSSLMRRHMDPSAVITSRPTEAHDLHLDASSHRHSASSALQSRISTQHQTQRKQSDLLEQTVKKKDHPDESSYSEYSVCEACLDQGQETGKDEVDSSLAKLASNASNPPNNDNGTNITGPDYTDKFKACVNDGLPKFYTGRPDDKGSWAECKADGTELDYAQKMSAEILKNANNTCAALERLLWCRNENSCLTETIIDACKDDKTKFKDHFGVECEVDCEAPTKGSSSRLPFAASLAAALFTSLFQGVFVQ